MVKAPGRSTHQPAGTGSSVSSPESLQRFSSTQARVSLHGQHNGCVLPQQGGEGALPVAFQEVGRPSEMVSGLTNPDLGQIYPRKNEHRSRLSESLGSGNSNRVDSGPFSPGACLEDVAQAHGGLVRDKVQPQTTDLHLSSSRSSGSGARRSEHQLGGHDRLRISPSLSHEQSHSEGENRSGLHHSSRPVLALSAVVSRSSRLNPHSSAQARGSQERSGSAPLRSPSQEPGIPKLTRMASVRTKLQSLGASSSLVRLVARARRKGTHSVYDSHWKRWLTWCQDKGVDPSHPSSIEFANFLSYLFEHLGKSVSTVRVHRSAISSTIRQLGGPSFSEDPLIRDALRGASLIAARTPRRLPAWDLFLVLASLRESPYEPLSSATLMNLTFKTVFLVSLASGRRASEINGLSGLPSDVSREPDGSYSLRFLPDFLAKNQSPQAPSPIVRVPPLVPFCPDDEDAKLCPVRALRRYIHFTKTLRVGKRKLFISHNPSYKKDIIASTLSGWLRKVIAKAYQHTANTSQMPSDIRRAHEIRAWASSLAFQESWSMRDVLQAAYWKSESPFINFYLRDVRACRQDGTYGIASIVAAGQNVQLR